MIRYWDMTPHFARADCRSCRWLGRLPWRRFWRQHVYLRHMLPFIWPTQTPFRNKIPRAPGA